MAICRRSMNCLTASMLLNFRLLFASVPQKGNGCQQSLNQQNTATISCHMHTIKVATWPLPSRVSFKPPTERLLVMFAAVSSQWRLLNAFVFTLSTKNTHRPLAPSIDGQLIWQSATNVDEKALATTVYEGAEKRARVSRCLSAISPSMNMKASCKLVYQKRVVSNSRLEKSACFGFPTHSLKNFFPIKLTRSLFKV